MYLIPKPQQCKKTEGRYIILYDSKITIHTSCGAQVYAYAQMLQEDFEKYAGFSPAITKGNSEKTSVTLEISQCQSPDAYELKVNEGGISIKGGSQKGLFYGIQTLRQMIRQEGPCIPCMEIRDYPCIQNRGLYYDVTRGRVPTLSYLKSLADKMAYYKMNQLQLYVEHSFLFEHLSEVWRDDTPLTAQDILELDAYCKERNIDLVPSISCFGHLYKVLRTKTYGHLCELPDAQEQPFGFVDRMEHHTLDVSNPDSLAFVKRLIDEYIPLFTSGYFNIGADETFDLGKGRSKALADEKGIKRLYMDFVKELCEYVISKGKRPMFWGDIICQFPEAVQELPEGTICLNWGYERDQSEDSSRKLAKAGAVQYMCPGVSGWDQFVNQIDVSYENIRRMCSYGVKYKADGILTTDWGDCGHINHPDFGVTGMIYGAAFSWNQKIPDFEEMNRQISRVEFTDSSETLVSVFAEISKCWVFKWRDAVNFMEHRAPALTHKELLGSRQCLQKLEQITGQLYRSISGLHPEERKRIMPYLTAADGMKLIQKTGLILCANEYKGKELFIQEPDSLACELEQWFYEYKKVWRTVSRESELYRIQNVINWYADYLRSI